jgi:phosphotransferase system HPr (HPr) family protein
VVECTVTIRNALGLHARAAAKFVHAAGRFASRVRVARGDREIDGKSIMGLLLLAASPGTVIRITADGPDENDAMATLCRLVERGFDERPDAAIDDAAPRVRADGSREPSCD